MVRATRMIAALAALATMMALLPGCTAPSINGGANCHYPVDAPEIGFLADAFNRGQGLPITDVRAGAGRWNAVGSHAPVFVEGARPNMVDVQGWNDPGTTIVGLTDFGPPPCPYSNRVLRLNFGVLAWESLNVRIGVAAHELGHALGLGESPFHNQQRDYHIAPADCHLVALMFWSTENTTVCGITGPTTLDTGPINNTYL